MLRVEEANKTEEKELAHLKKKGGRSGQGLSGLSIYEEERVLRLMEEQEVPARSGKVYRFIPAERNDMARNTGSPKYLLVKPCGDDGVKCELIVKHNPVMSTGKRKREVF